MLTFNQLEQSLRDLERKEEQEELALLRQPWRTLSEIGERFFHWSDRHRDFELPIGLLVFSLGPIILVLMVAFLIDDSLIRKGQTLKGVQN